MTRLRCFAARRLCFALTLLLTVGSVHAATLAQPSAPTKAPSSDIDCQTPSVTLRFAAMGDVPYTIEERELLDQQIDELPADITFVIHVGDIKPGFFPCLDVMYEQVATSLKRSAAPCFIIPGDNEWNECPRKSIGPIHWRRHFAEFDQHWEHSLDVARQEGYPENFAFVHERVLVIGINQVAGRVLDQEAWTMRLTANAEWVEHHVDSRNSDFDCLVLLAHAGPGENQELFYDRLDEIGGEMGKPGLLIHGNGHHWRDDRPFDAVNLRRVQVDQGGIAPPLIVNVAADDNEAFRFERGERYSKPDESETDADATRDEAKRDNENRDNATDEISTGDSASIVEPRGDRVTDC